MVTRKSDAPNLGREKARAILESQRQSIIDRTVDYRWYVAEVRPAGEDDYGHYVPEFRKVVASYFDSLEGAQAWYDEHLPDPGKTLKVYRDRLITTERWMPG